MMHLRQKYNHHRNNAKRRGIAFELTFEEWFNIWQKSGHLHQRGNKRGQYHMARFGDEGPYAVGNVEIIIGDNNRRQMTYKHSKEARAKMSLQRMGNKYSLGHKNGLGNKSHTGLTQSTKTRAKISSSLKAYHQRRKSNV